MFRQPAFKMLKACDSTSSMDPVTAEDTRNMVCFSQAQQCSSPQSPHKDLRVPSACEALDAGCRELGDCVFTDYAVDTLGRSTLTAGTMFASQSQVRSPTKGMPGATVASTAGGTQYTQVRSQYSHRDVPNAHLMLQLCGQQYG